MPSPRAGFSGWGSWNFAGRSFVDFGYVGFSRGRMETLSGDVIFGDTTYKAGASVSATMKSSLPYLDYRYGFVKNDKMQFGLSLGVAYPILKADLAASAGVIGPGGPIVGQTVTKTAKLSTPLPFLGLTFEGGLADRLSAGVRLNGIFAAVHPYSGSIFDAEAHIDWHATHHFGVGAAYAYTKFALKRQRRTRSSISPIGTTDRASTSSSPSDDCFGQQFEGHLLLLCRAMLGCLRYFESLLTKTRRMIGLLARWASSAAASRFWLMSFVRSST